MRSCWSSVLAGTRALSRYASMPSLQASTGSKGAEQDNRVMSQASTGTPVSPHSGRSEHRQSAPSRQQVPPGGGSQDSTISSSCSPPRLGRHPHQFPDFRQCGVVQEHAESETGQPGVAQHSAGSGRTGPVTWLPQWPSKTAHSRQENLNDFVSRLVARSLYS
jgi:hypothetical protein